MATKAYDVCVADKRGEKTYWKNVGVVLKTDKGYSLKLEVVPVGWDGWASLFTPKDKTEKPKTREPGDDDAF